MRYLDNRQGIEHMFDPSSLSRVKILGMTQMCMTAVRIWAVARAKGKPTAQGATPAHGIRRSRALTRMI